MTCTLRSERLFWSLSGWSFDSNGGVGVARVLSILRVTLDSEMGDQELDGELEM